MSMRKLHLEEMSIGSIFDDPDTTYEVPVYQRNFAWEEDEINALVRDVYDAFVAQKTTYYIGTLVVFDKGDNIYEVIDGQQRLTVISLVLNALQKGVKNKLTYRARKKSKDTLVAISDPNLKIAEKDLDPGIKNGFDYAKDAVKNVSEADKENFGRYFKNNVHIVRYRVPQDVDLNHYFEVMNSRGEQLEKHEIVKATLGGLLNADDLSKFSRVWEACSEMDVYIQQKYPETSVFGINLYDCPKNDFDSLPQQNGNAGKKRLSELIEVDIEEIEENKNIDKGDSFQPIIDFPNFLLIVLKITRMGEIGFVPAAFSLDDKELIGEFGKVKLGETFVKKFASNLLKAKYLLDNYIIHHINSDDKLGDNPWHLQFMFWDGKKRYPKNLSDTLDVQDELVHLLSMFEVAFTPRQRKNYLFYCLLHLFEDTNLDHYLAFLQNLAKKYLYDVYLTAENLSETNNRPKPNSFDNALLLGNKINLEIKNPAPDFVAIYGNGTEVCKGIQLFVFNYMDYKIWKKYLIELRGKEYKRESLERRKFFDALGCSNFDLDPFDNFYFSRTRKSLEHYYPQNKVREDKLLTETQINCFGNFAMIGADANSSGSDWDPRAKLDHYTDRKTDPLSVASLKFKIMMQICSDNLNDEKNRPRGLEWSWDDIQEHQRKMVAILMENIAE